MSTTHAAPHSATTPVRHRATWNLTTPATTAVADVARLMIESGVRHVLVREDATEGGRLSGIVSIRDVVEPLLADRT